MPVQFQGFGGTVGEVDAGRNQQVSLRPAGATGEFSVGILTGALVATIAAGSPLVAFRNNGSGIILLKAFFISSVIVTTTITASIATALDLVVARSYSAIDTGGTTIDLSGNNQKVRTSLASSNAQIRAATTGAMTPGTRTLDALALARQDYVTGTVAPGLSLGRTELLRTDSHESPIVLAASEGVILRQLLAGPVTGAYQVGVQIEWSEVASY
jgi:hypothetical protein